MCEDIDKLKVKIKELESENNKLKNQVKDLKWMNIRLTEINSEYRSKEQIWFTGEENSIGEHEIGCETDCGGDCSNCDLNER